MTIISADEILSMEQRYRATFINSVGGFKSLCLIGTISKDGMHNLAVFNSFFHVGANPPLFGLVIRPDSVERHTLDNILATGTFTVNHVNASIYRQAHQTSARYAREQSEFKATHLTPEFTGTCTAPFVKESDVRMSAKLIRRINLDENGTCIIIAVIQEVQLPDDCIGEDGFVDLEKAGTVTCQGLDSYHQTKRLARLSYAKPDKSLTEIPC